MDASLAQVSNHSDLSFKDSGNIRDQMDRSSETLLCRAWDTNAAAIGPALAAAYFPKNVDAWVSMLMDHVSHGSKFKEVLDSLEAIGKAVSYLAGAAVETARTTAKSADLLNYARRALWEKRGMGILPLSHDSVVYPFEDSLLFGTGLE